ncbi:acyltransferase family protein [Roseobacteraceae bacterium S113]
MPHHALPYRPDIDGLRAIAVLSVVLYHFGVPGLQGGFVGVDIFFVLSGFLIGGIVWREQEATGAISLTNFYARRIRRLAPAYVVMALASAVAAWLILLPFEFREFGKQLIAATIYLSNVFFWREAGYFDAASEEKPLLHTWSLSVEEQFYIVLPLALIALYKLVPRLRLAVLWLAFAISLAACLWVTPRDAVSTFYLFHFRAWELLAGVLLAVHLARGWQPRGHALLSLTGLALLAYALTQTQAGPGFPGWQATLPVAGTVLLLTGGLAPHAVTRALSWRGPVAIGLISYSLYLWHWPVFVFSHYARGGYSGGLEIAGWIALSLGLATLSWRFVEQPFRGAWPRQKPLFGMAALASFMLLGFGAILFRSDGLPNRFAPEVRPHIAASADFLQDFSRCTTSETGPFAGLETCPIGPDGAPQVLIWGDSHLRAFKEGVDQAAWEANRPGLLIWRAGCPPLYDVEKRESYATPAQDAQCTAANAQIATAIAGGGFSDIVLIGRWSYYAEGRGVGRDAENTIALSTPFEDLVPPTLAAMDAAGARVHVVRQVPEIPYYDSREAARALAHGRIPPAMSAPRDQALARANLGHAPWAASQGQLSILDPWPALCTETTCEALPGGAPYYFDNNHLTNAGAIALRGLFAPVFAHE